MALRQRACRHFAPDPVPDEDIEQVLRAATHAPSAENTQPWVFVVVRDDANRARIAGIAQRLWSGGARDYALPHLDERLLGEVDASIEAGFGGAPVLVVVGADLRGAVHEIAVESSIWPAVQNLLLAAAALGYGSALTTLTALVTDELREATGLPPDVRPMAVIPIGRPARPLGPPRREPVTAKAHRERFGQPW